jgi:hypothetical protein
MALGVIGLQLQACLECVTGLLKPLKTLSGLCPGFTALRLSTPKHGIEVGDTLPVESWKRGGCRLCHRGKQIGSRNKPFKTPIIKGAAKGANP